jgi:phage terminase large subunit-like protein
MDRLSRSEREEMEALFASDFARLSRLLVGADPYATSIRVREICKIVEALDTTELIDLARRVTAPRLGAA